MVIFRCQDGRISLAFDLYDPCFVMEQLQVRDPIGPYLSLALGWLCFFQGLYDEIPTPLSEAIFLLIYSISEDQVIIELGWREHALEEAFNLSELPNEEQILFMVDERLRKLVDEMPVLLHTA
jgi:hypothetical protein